MQTKWFKIASLMGALAVMLGAFGAHALKSTLEAAGTLETYKTAVMYHFLHSFFIMIISLSPFHDRMWISRIAMISLIGIVCFSGSLYLLSTLQWSWPGPITPVGGLLLIAAWILGALKARDQREG